MTDKFIATCQKNKKKIKNLINTQTWSLKRITLKQPIDTKEWEYVYPEQTMQEMHNSLIDCYNVLLKNITDINIKISTPNDITKLQTTLDALLETIQNNLRNNQNIDNELLKEIKQSIDETITNISQKQLEELKTIITNFVTIFQTKISTITDAINNQNLPQSHMTELTKIIETNPVNDETINEIINVINNKNSENISQLNIIKNLLSNQNDLITQHLINPNTNVTQRSIRQTSLHTQGEQQQTEDTQNTQQLENRLKSELHAKNKELQICIKKLETQEEENTTLQTTIKNLQQDNQNLYTQITSLDETITQLNTDIEKLTDFNNQEREKYLSTYNENADLKAQNKELETQLTNENKTDDTLINMISDYISTFISRYFNTYGSQKLNLEKKEEALKIEQEKINKLWAEMEMTTKNAMADVELANAKTELAYADAEMIKAQCKLEKISADNISEQDAANYELQTANANRQSAQIKVEEKQKAKEAAAADNKAQ